MTTQSITEAQAMFADLQTAQTLADLDQLYVNWIGYSIVEDDATATFESVRDLLDGYIGEFCKETGAGPVFCVDGTLYTLADMLTANADDEGLCEWLHTAEIGACFPALVNCRRLA